MLATASGGIRNVPPDNVSDVSDRLCCSALASAAEYTPSNSLSVASSASRLLLYATTAASVTIARAGRRALATLSVLNVLLCWQASARLWMTASSGMLSMMSVVIDSHLRRAPVTSSSGLVRNSLRPRSNSDSVDLDRSRNSLSAAPGCARRTGSADTSTETPWDCRAQDPADSDVSDGRAPCRRPRAKCSAPRTPIALPAIRKERSAPRQPSSSSVKNASPRAALFDRQSRMLLRRWCRPRTARVDLVAVADDASGRNARAVRPHDVTSRSTMPTSPWFNDRATAAPARVPMSLPSRRNVVTDVKRDTSAPTSSDLLRRTNVSTCGARHSCMARARARALSAPPSGVIRARRFQNGRRSISVWRRSRLRTTSAMASRSGSRRCRMGSIRCVGRLPNERRCLKRAARARTLSRCRPGSCRNSLASNRRQARRPSGAALKRRSRYSTTSLSVSPVMAASDAVRSAPSTNDPRLNMQRMTGDRNAWRSLTWKRCRWSLAVVTPARSTTQRPPGSDAMRQTRDGSQGRRPARFLPEVHARPHMICLRSPKVST
ncbi:hypothetical protein PBRA_002815 [Plasmodiophora brassicae]|uniref:Uncharacterized protein n=1 Tax=Plasmodiophora brassicae TaxID=37360 RepID=A0A0G4J5G8_PLABS|nr:hypothetical protein PBRA_002815 [Plasmodiophora brassicae]